MTNNKGFSLVELVASMAVFIGLMLIISSAFENILSKGGQQVKSAETNTEGIVGLEMLRSDLEHAGFGLPWRYPVAPNPVIDETTSTTGVDGITYPALEETAAPRAILVQTSTTTGKIIDNSATTNPGTAYLVVKSTRVPLNDTVQKWAYVNYSSESGTNKSYVKKWETSDDLADGNRVITVSSTFTIGGAPDRPLVMASAATNPNYYYQIPNATPAHPPAAYQPADGSQLYVVYGADPGSDLRMPYNRADYYVKNTDDRPQSCNSGTGILYKGVVNHDADGTFTAYPLLNCVGDMQVEYELDTTGTGAGSITFSSTLPATAENIRSQLRNIRVFILAHEGGKDRNYSYPSDSIQVGDASRSASSGRTWDGSSSCTGSNCMATTFGADWRNYRWKVYTIVVRPKNLN